MSTAAPKVVNGVRTPWLRWMGRMGVVVWAQWHELHQAAAVMGTALWDCARPRRWGRPVRQALARQVLGMGVEPLGIVGAMGVFVGVSVVVQLTYWTGETGQSQLLGALLVAIVARELGPLLINLLVIIRSGGAMTTELGVLKINGEMGSVEARGDDVFTQLVLPRMLGLAISTFCLTIVFILVAFASGFLFAALTGQGGRDLLLFADTLARAVQPKDIFNILVKSIVPALFAGASCSLAGLGVGGSLAEIPAATQRALTRSVAGLFVISAVVSLLTYL